jgi:hypothetical protein
MAVLREPNTWATAQAEFRRAFAARGAEAPRTAVWVEWWRGRRDDRVLREEPRTWVAVYDVKDHQQSSPLMVFPIDADLDPKSGASEGVVVGEVGLNAVCCVEVGGATVWPTYNPVPRTRPARLTRVVQHSAPVGREPARRLNDRQRVAVVALWFVAGVGALVMRGGARTAFSDGVTIGVGAVFVVGAAVAVAALLAQWTLRKRWAAGSPSGDVPD